MEEKDIAYDLRLHLIALRVIFKNDPENFEEYKNLILRNFSFLIYEKNEDSPISQILEELKISKNYDYIIKDGLQYLDKFLNIQE